MRVAMIGTGYVGLVSGACFSDFGHEVVCVDKDAGKVERLRAGEIPIYEPGLEAIVRSNIDAGRLKFTKDLADTVPHADIVFIAVGTPTDERSGEADLTHVYGVAREIAPLLAGYTVVVTKSTVPVGTGDEVEAILRDLRPDADVAVVSNPEFLREGSAIEDFKRPDRIVIGTTDGRARARIAELYRPLALNHLTLVYSDRRTSELIKYASNAFLAMKVTFINEMADLCEQAGGDAQLLAHAVGLDRRIGPKFLHPGPGFGGSCFPKDTRALVRMAERLGARTRLVEATVVVNDARKRQMVHKIRGAVGGSLAGTTIGVLGLSFKPNTDDMRDSPALEIVPALLAEGAAVQAYDPACMEEAARLLPGISFRDNAYAVADGADALTILTEWDHFRASDLARLGALLKRRILVDLRNVYTPAEARAHGFTYVSVGRRTASPTDSPDEADRPRLPSAGMPDGPIASSRPLSAGRNGGVPASRRWAPVDGSPASNGPESIFE